LLVGAALALSLWAARACARGTALPAPH
jgi:hypothetical protein